MAEVLAAGLLGVLAAVASGWFSVVAQRNERKAMNELIDAYERLDSLPQPLKKRIRERLGSALVWQAWRLGPTPARRLRSLSSRVYAAGFVLVLVGSVAIGTLDGGWQATLREVVIPLTFVIGGGLLVVGVGSFIVSEVMQRRDARKDVSGLNLAGPRDAEGTVVKGDDPPQTDG